MFLEGPKYNNLILRGLNIYLSFIYFFFDLKLFKFKLCGHNLGRGGGGGADTTPLAL